MYILHDRRFDGTNGLLTWFQGSVLEAAEGLGVLLFGSGCSLQVALSVFAALYALSSPLSWSLVLISHIGVVSEGVIQVREQTK